MSNDTATGALTGDGSIIAIRAQKHKVTRPHKDEYCPSLPNHEKVDYITFDETESG